LNFAAVGHIKGQINSQASVQNTQGICMWKMSVNTFFFKYPVSGELMGYVKGSRADSVQLFLYVCVIF